MGQKVNPKGFRIGVNKGWDSVWMADKKAIAENILEDNKIRKFLKKNYESCAISKVLIQRNASKLVIDIYTGKPGILIGQKGAGIEKVKAELKKLLNKEFILNVKEVKNVDADAVLVAENIALQLEKRVAFKRAVSSAIQRAIKAGAQGIKVNVAGRLNGAEIARSEHYQEGSLPLHTIRSNVDYGTATARTTYGAIGVKVWIYFGEILGKANISGAEETPKEGGKN